MISPLRRASLPIRAQRPASHPRPSAPTPGQVGTDVYRAVRAEHIAAATRPDTILMLCVASMVIFGLIMVQSASQFADPIDPGIVARRDLIWALIGGAVLLVTSQIDYRRWRPLARPSIITAIILLVAVLKFGTNVGGAQRWLSFGSFLSFQPSEMAKLAFILFAADWLTRHEGQLSLRAIAPLGAVAAGIIGIVLLQNDLGTALILSACALAILIVSGMPLLQLALMALAATGFGAIIIAGTPFRRARVLAFLHPTQCQGDVGYHICQSLIAIGSGGPLGRGLGGSLQKAGFLPAPYTDSIFAVIGEELGLWGTLLVLACFALLLWRGLRIARAAPDTFGALLALGITCWLVVQAILNIGSSIAAIPFTGVPLPFMSFGGSSLVVSLAAVGILLNISAQGAGHAARHAHPTTF